MSRKKRRYTGQESAYLDAVAAETARLDRIPPAAARRLKGISVRCPAGGCLLAAVRELPLRGGGAHYVCEARHGRQIFTVGILNWHFYNRELGCSCCDPAMDWIHVACRHGDGHLENAWLMQCVDVGLGSVHGRETHEHILGSAPEELRRGARAGVFHPEASTWRPLKP